MKNKTVGVVIPHFRAPEALKVTLEHIEKQVGVKTEVFVRDNSEDNILFTRAVNEGLRRFAYREDCDYVLVLNHDAILSPQCLSRMVMRMDVLPKAGIAGGIVLSEDGSINWAGGADAFPWGNHIVFYWENLPKEPYGTHWVNGACMLLRTEMLREVGLLDENMRFICSDADLSFTARSRGWLTIVVPDAFVKHESSGSMDAVTPWLNKVKFEDHLYFTEKWLSGDLYRRISVEGSTLNNELIDSTIQFAKQKIEFFNAILQGAEEESFE